MKTLDQLRQETRDKALNNALEVLNRLNAQYDVEDESGNKFTNIAKTRKKVNDFSPLQISPQIRAAKPGDVLVFDGKDFPLNRLQSTITAKANKILGSGRYTSVQDPAKKQVYLAIEDLPKDVHLENLLVTHDGART